MTRHRSTLTQRRGTSSLAVLLAALMTCTTSATGQVPQFDLLDSFVLDGTAQIVSGAGDVNGDGFSDILVGGGSTMVNVPGRATIILGGLTPVTRILDVPAIERRRIDVSSAGDMNGDGLDDVIVSPITPQRDARLFLSGLFNGPGILLRGQNVGSGLSDVAGAGDVNGDGLDDALLGESAYSGANTLSGLISVYLGGDDLGGQPDFAIVGAGANFELGADTEGAGDFNGDGFDDILSSTHAVTHKYQFEATVFLGGSPLDPVADVTLLPPPSFGAGFLLGDVSSAGDFNGDGYADILIGSSGTLEQGAAFLYFGGPSPDGVADLVFEGQAAGKRLGLCVADPGDVNQDGFDDVVIADDSGDLHVYLGGDPGDTLADALLTVPDFQFSLNGQFPQFINDAGDFDGNGLPDIVAGNGDTVYVFGPACPPGAACILSFVADPPAIFPGEDTTLRWEVSGTPSLVIDSGVGSVGPASGQITVTPEGNTTYRLSSSHGSDTRVASVPVRWRAPIAQLQAATTNPYADTPFTLTVTIEGAESATLSGIGSIPADGGEFSITVSEATTFTLTATNAVGSVTKVLSVTPRAPLIESFKASPAPILFGEHTLLEWSVQGAVQVEIAPPGFISTEGFNNLLLQPAQTTNYIITATNSAGSSIGGVTVEVLPFIIESFTATPSTVQIGERTTLEWSVRGEANVVIEGLGAQPQQGSLVVEPGATRTYRLRAVGGSVVDTAEVIVTVPGPAPLSFSWSATDFPGTRPLLVPLSPFDVYVVALASEGILDYEFRVNYTDCLVVLEDELPDGGFNAGNAVAGARNYVVDGAFCLFGLVTPLLRLNLLALDQDCLDQALLELSAVEPSSFDPPSFGYTSCLGDNLPFRAGDFTTLVLQEPVVPAIVLSAEATTRREGIEIAWWISGGMVPHSVAVMRSERDNPQEPAVLARFLGEQSGEANEFVDTTAVPGVAYVYIVAVALGEASLIHEVEATIPMARLPTQTRLLGNVPNPFNPRTEIRFEVSGEGPVTLELFEASGRMVRQVDLGRRDAGSHTWTWDGKDTSGNPVSSGIYYTRLTTTHGSDVRRLALVR